MRTLGSIVLLVATITVSSVHANPDLTGFEKVFGDEFNTGALDTSKWNTAPLWGPYPVVNGEEQFYVDVLGVNKDYLDYTPFEFTADTLKINAEPVEMIGIPPGQPASTDQVWQQYPNYHYNDAYSTSDRSYLSGIISSSDSFKFTHGYAEVRARIPSGQGLWPAFWLLNSHYVENSPEIDVMEMHGHATNEVHQYAHYFDKDWNSYSFPEQEDPFISSIDLSEDFHTYGILWTPTYLAWFVDGVETRRVTDDSFLISKQAMYIIANLAVGGHWPGSPNATTPFPSSYELDYIRVYQKTPPTTITADVLESDYLLMFNDEFSGNTLDAARWNTSRPAGPFKRVESQEQLFVDSTDRFNGYVNNPFSVGTGSLKIEASTVAAQALPSQEPLTDPVWVLYPKHEYYEPYMVDWAPAYTSGLISSHDAFKFVHGYVEMRAKLPEGGGLWPFFNITYGYNVGSLPEIEVVGFDGAAGDSVRQSYNYYNVGGQPVDFESVFVNESDDFSDSFHTFGVQWHPELIRWYVDGEIVQTYTGSDVSRQIGYLSVGLAVGGDRVGAIDANFPATLEVDYIRAYQLDGELGSSDGGNSGGNNGFGLTLDVLETSDYGYRFQDQNDHQESVAFDFSHVGSDVTLTVLGFDVDTADEVEVLVNGVSLGFLAITPNEGFGTSTLTIDASILQSSNNLLVFRQIRPGWKWGVTDLLLQAEPVIEIIDLTIGTENSGEFGYKYNGQVGHRESAMFSFSHTGSDLNLSLTGFDIDYGDEVEVLVNNVSIGYLEKSPNEGIAQSTLTIPASLLVMSENMLVFKQIVPGWKWGVTDLLLTADPASNGSGTSVPTLLVGSLEPGEYGYNYNGQTDHRESAMFSFSHSESDLTLNVTGFDIDVGTEVEVLVNDVSVGHLQKTPNESTASSTLTIPASLLNGAENSLVFQQIVPGWKWGVTSLLLITDSGDPDGNGSVTSEPSLLVGLMESGEYGYNYNGQTDHRESATFSFSHSETDLTLNVTGFDIDAATEVEVLVNDERVGYLQKTPNESTASSTFTIPASLLNGAENTLVFKQIVPGWKWGVTGLLLQTD